MSEVVRIVKKALENLPEELAAYTDVIANELHAVLESEPEVGHVQIEKAQWVAIQNKIETLSDRVKALEEQIPE